MNSFINIIFGPLGQAMPILKKYGRLFENSDFFKQIFISHTKK